METKRERIVINIDPTEVGVHYEPVTSEWTSVDHHRADEIALYGLCKQCIELRQKHGLTVPAAMTMLVEAQTYRELL